MMSKTKKTRLLFMLTFILMMIFTSLQISVFAEGSKELTADPTGNRPYTEWQSGKSIGIARQQRMHVYVNKGETIYLASSVAASDGWIIVRDDNGNETKIEVTLNGNGYISNYEQEQAGPNIDGSNTAGYTPMSYVPGKTGVYEIEFQRKNPGTANPSAVLNNGNWKQNTSTVAAWDITVAGSNNVPIDGRVWADYLSLNMGANSKRAKSKIYVLTADGYTYMTDFNGMDPFGFIFFANNRGLVSTKTNSSIYHQVICRNQ